MTYLDMFMTRAQREGISWTLSYIPAEGFELRFTGNDGCNCLFENAVSPHDCALEASAYLNAR